MRTVRTERCIRTMNDYEMNHFYEGPEQGETMGRYLTKTFAWMVGGLLTTFLVGMGVYLFVPIQVFYRMAYFSLVLGIVEVLIAWNLSKHLYDMSPATATGLFFLYAVLNGLTFSALFYAYATTTLMFAFLSAGVYFGVMAVYGLVTKRDLSSWGHRLGCGLVALLVVNLLGMLIGFGRFELLISGAGVVLFLCLTAYDMKRIQSLYYNFGHDEQMMHKASIYGALELYLDFINLFMYLLRMFARSRDD